MAPLWAHVERCRRYGAGAPGKAGIHDPAGGYREADRGAQAPGTGMPTYPTDWPHSWRPCRADYIRIEAGELVLRNAAQPRALQLRRRADARRKAVWCGWKRCASRSGSRGEDL